MLNDSNQLGVHWSKFRLKCYNAFRNPLKFLCNVVYQLSELREIVVGSGRKVQLVTPIDEIKNAL